MFDSKRELLDKIRLGEDSYLELKEVRLAGRQVKEPHRHSLADEIAAFANSRGGVIVLGVQDRPREVLGIPAEALDAAELHVRQCGDLIDPFLAPTIERLELPTATGDEVPVIKIDVARTLFVHRSPGGYLLRVGSKKRPMSTEYLTRLLAERSRTGLARFDEEVVAEASLDDLQDDLVERFRTSRSAAESSRFLSNLHLARTDERGNLRPTVAGILLAATDPRQWLPSAYVQAVAYRGTEVRVGSDDPYQLDAEDVAGPLDAQVEGACRFVARNMKTAAFKNIGRVDRPQFDMAAVFEAVVNAVAHRDYSIHGSKIRLRLFR